MDPLPPERSRLLVVDDEPDMRATLQDVLRGAGFEADAAASGDEARRALAARAYALVVLDLRLGGEDGLALARQLRRDSACPLIMMSGASAEGDRVLLLELAADDFLVKPFAARELVARVRAVLRRSAGPAGASAPPPGDTPRHERLRFGDWVLDATRQVLHRVDGAPCALSRTEYRLLEILVRHPQRVWTRDELLERLRGADAEVFDRTIDVLMLRLRRKIEPNPRYPVHIQTERGRGYRFCAEVAAGG